MSWMRREGSVLHMRRTGGDGAGGGGRCTGEVKEKNELDEAGRKVCCI